MQEVHRGDRWSTVASLSLRQKWLNNETKLEINALNLIERYPRHNELSQCVDEEAEVGFMNSFGRRRCLAVVSQSLHPTHNTAPIREPSAAGVLQSPSYMSDFTRSNRGSRWLARLDVSSWGDFVMERDSWSEDGLRVVCCFERRGRNLTSWCWIRIMNIRLLDTHRFWAYLNNPLSWCRPQDSHVVGSLNITYADLFLLRCFVLRIKWIYLFLINM